MGSVAPAQKGVLAELSVYPACPNAMETILESQGRKRSSVETEHDDDLEADYNRRALLGCATWACMS
jgi:hypothetical protein